MPDDPPSPALPLAAIQARLHEVAGRLREPGAVDPDSRRILAELVDELSDALRSSQAPPGEVAQLAATTTHLADALHEPPEHRGWLAQVQAPFEEAALRAEAHAPVAVGLA